jgi:hypothetical protein
MFAIAVLAAGCAARGPAAVPAAPAPATTRAPAVGAEPAPAPAPREDAAAAAPERAPIPDCAVDGELCGTCIVRKQTYVRTLDDDAPVPSCQSATDIYDRCVRRPGQLVPRR